LSGHTGEQEIVKAVDRWYGEEKDYSFKKNKFSGEKSEPKKQIYNLSRQTIRKY
jgi:hypothetical protein